VAGPFERRTVKFPLFRHAHFLFLALRWLLDALLEVWTLENLECKGKEAFGNLEEQRSRGNEEKSQKLFWLLEQLGSLVEPTVSVHSACGP
jgi:hypothetical protein